MERRRRTDHAEPAAAHTELPLVEGRRRLDLECVVELPHGGGELERYDHSCRFELAHDVQDPAGHMVDAGRREAHLRVLDDVEEVGRAQVLVAGRMPGVEAVGVDREPIVVPLGPTSYEPSNRSKRP
jgi:hypothetical protein